MGLHHHHHGHDHGHGHSRADHHNHGQHHHGHHHGHHHHAQGVSHGRAFAIGIALNLAYVAVEAGVGLAIGSLALLADAGHNLSDVAGLALAWAAAWAATRSPSPRFTYGWRGASVLAAFANAMLLLLACGAIAWEAVGRMAAPAPVEGLTMMIVAGIGIVINAGTALLFMKGAAHDLNIRGAYLHMAADAVVSLGVVLAGGLILLTGQAWLDPLVSLLIVVVIVWGTWGLLRQSLAMMLQATPPGIDADAVRGMIASQPGVASVHDVHIWNIGTTDVALTAHVVMPDGLPGDAWHAALAAALKAAFGIDHPTVQIERGDGPPCHLEPDDHL